MIPSDDPPGSPLSGPPDDARLITTARNVPSPSTTQITSNTNTCGLARRYFLASRITAGDSGATSCCSQGRTGGVLLSQALASQVPSALRGLTALFGMGRGVSPSP